eukprot:732197-Rhodomonas_salina.2
MQFYSSFTGSEMGSLCLRDIYEHDVPHTQRSFTDMCLDLNDDLQCRGPNEDGHVRSLSPIRARGWLVTHGKTNADTHTHGKIVTKRAWRRSSDVMPPLSTKNVAEEKSRRPAEVTARAELSPPRRTQRRDSWSKEHAAAKA